MIRVLESIVYQGPVVKSFVSLPSSLMTDKLTVIAKVLSNTLMFLLQICAMQKLLTFFSAKISISYLPYFKIEIFTSR